MKSPAKRLTAGQALRALGTLIALGLMAWLLARQWSDITRALSEMDAARFWGAFGLVMASRLFVSARWHMLLRGAAAGIRFPESARITFAGLFAANFLPTTIGGDVVRLGGVIARGHGAALAAASLVMDRLVGMAGMAVFAPFGAARVMAGGLLGAGHSAGLALSLPGKLKRNAAYALRRLGDIARTWLRRPQFLLASLFFTALHMAVWFAAMWLLLDGLNDRMPYFLIASLWSLVYFITQIPISINGLGVQELSIAYIFAAFGGVSDHSALVMGLVFRVLVTLASLPGALFVGQLLPTLDRAKSVLEGLRET
ncbi:MAG: flippase-like domain-containing protein [Chloroflexi bacterium]|nr:flippase-like domain-containing protein [Chloroflexota bacterium]